MSEYDDTEPLLLPQRSRLLYIGPPKTGTTTLQESARVSRSALYEHGVYYPGTGRNHREAIQAFMRRKTKADRSLSRRVDVNSKTKAPPLKQWKKLMADIDSEPDRRILISHEFAGEADAESAAEFVDELGPEQTHIAITLRPLSAMLPSRWNQSLKDGLTQSLDEWLERYFGLSDTPISARQRRYLNQGSLVNQWAKIAGPENVTVIILDGLDKTLLTRTFERMLGLPESTLTAAGVESGRATNRTMTIPETEVYRHANALIKETCEVSWPLYYDVIKQGAIEQMLERRTPSDDEPRIRMPHWAAERARRDGKQYAEQIADSGVRVVGDLASLYGPPPVSEDSPSVDAEVYRELAVEALSGAYAGALKFEKYAISEILQSRDSRKQVAKLKKSSVHEIVKQLPRHTRVQRAAEGFTTRDLAGALALRLRHKLKTGKSMRLK